MEVPDSVPATSTSTGRGQTRIADEVVSVIARIAADEVEGIHQIAESTFTGVLRRLGRHAGVSSEVGYEEAAIDVSIVVEYGFPVMHVAESLRTHIIDVVQHMTGIRVVEVNIDVHDVYVPKSRQRKRRKLE